MEPKFPANTKSIYKTWTRQLLKQGKVEFSGSYQDTVDFHLLLERLEIPSKMVRVGGARGKYLVVVTLWGGKA